MFGEITLQLVMEKELILKYQAQFGELKWSKYVTRAVGPTKHAEI